MARDAAGRFTSGSGGAQVAALQSDLEAFIAKTVVKLEFEIVANLVEATPVDTGHARANWIGSIGQPYEGEDDGGGAQAAGQAAVAGFAVAQGDVWISNNVPYINRLDLGSSSQAPAGFVQSAIDVAVATVQSGASGLVLTTGAELGEAGAENLAAAFTPEGLP